MKMNWAWHSLSLKDRTIRFIREGVQCIRDGGQKRVPSRKHYE
jgi:hypothetical protein